MSSQSLDAQAIRRYITELADELPHGDQPRTLILVGGALLAWRGLREATRDVDCVRRLDDELRAAVARVADRHDLAPKWLNDAAAGFLPATFEPRDCDILLSRPLLEVLGASFDQLFVMKLYASRAVDTDDLEAIWPHCSFESAEAAAAAFYAAYPHVQRDTHFADHIRDVVGGAPPTR